MEPRLPNLPRATAGFSLVELMVALALSLLLLLGVVAIFSSSRVSYESTDQLSRIQESGRFALDEISRRVRSAGFTGCSRQPNFTSSALRNSEVLQWAFMRGAVEGSDGATPNDSDVVVVRGARMDFQPVRVTTDMGDPQLPLVVENTNGFSVNDVAVAYSCEGQSFFQVTGVGANTLAHAVVAASATTPGNAFATTNYPFRQGAEVAPVETAVYFVGPSPPLAPTDPAPPAAARSLYRRVNFGPTEELVQGVEQMQAEYGFDDEGDRLVDRYIPASAVTNWDRVLAVRVALLVRSVDQYGTDTDRRTYQLLSEATGTRVVAPGDRRLREVFTVTASIRNRTRTD
jgi:type IV pilus assembly protein PilW